MQERTLQIERLESKAYLACVSIITEDTIHEVWQIEETIVIEAAGYTQAFGRENHSRFFVDEKAVWTTGGQRIHTIEPPNGGPTEFGCVNVIDEQTITAILTAFLGKRDTFRETRAS